MPNIFPQKMSQSSVAFSTDSALSKIAFNRLLVAMASIIMSAVFLTGCGQKGDLYLTEEAPSNTNFMLYKGNKSSDNSDTLKQTETNKAIEQQKIKEAAAQDPQDY